MVVQSRFWQRTKKQERIDKLLHDGYTKFSKETDEKHGLTARNIRLETWLRQQAKKNSRERFGDKDSEKRKELAELLKRGRMRDKRDMTHTLYGAWEISFNAGVKELNKFYRTDLIALIRKEKRGKRNFRVLEIGAGTGRAAKEIQKEFPGVKYTATGLRKIPEFNRRGISKKINWRVLHALIIEKRIPQNSVDFIHSNLGLSYNSREDITKALRQCYKILRKGGKILFTYEAHDTGPKIPSGFKVIKYSPPSAGMGDDFQQHVFLLKKI
jgi:SAM-dependent methyltransferase